MNPFKIKTESGEHSKEIQEWLFSLGYTWGSGSTNLDELCSSFLYFDEYPDSLKPILTHDSSETFYELSSLPEAWFYDGKLQDKPEISNDPRSFLMLLLGTNEDIEYKNSDGEWETFVISSDYRIKPKPRICNGVELDPCLTKHPELGSHYYYYPDLTNVDLYGIKLWVNDADDIHMFELGFVYGTRISAVKHGHAMINLLD